MAKPVQCLQLPAPESGRDSRPNSPADTTSNQRRKPGALPTHSAPHQQCSAEEIPATKVSALKHSIRSSIWNHHFQHPLKTRELTGAPERFPGGTQLGMTCQLSPAAQQRESGSQATRASLAGRCNGAGRPPLREQDRVPLRTTCGTARRVGKQGAPALFWGIAEGRADGLQTILMGVPNRVTELPYRPRTSLPQNAH